jgi:predicted TIM-barrel fold metal-dependent hydrolase
LFNLKQGQYHWLKANNAPLWPDKSIIARDFTEQDLQLASPLTLAGFIHIEAGFNNDQPWREIAWLETHCQKPFRTIAFINLEQEITSFKAQLAKLLSFSSVVGIRHIFDHNALQILNNKNTQQNIRYLAKKNLLLEIQMPVIDLSVIAQLVRILSSIKITTIINHAGFPPLPKQVKAWQQWQQGLAILAKQPYCFIKCSGWEMNSRTYSVNWVNEVLVNCIAYFGEQRVMLASNFPLCKFTNSYQQLWQNYQQLSITTNQFNKLCYANAKQTYQLKSL